MATTTRRRSISIWTGIAMLILGVLLTAYAMTGAAPNVLFLLGPAVLIAGGVTLLIGVLRRHR